MIEQENGIYRWTGTVDEAFDKKVYTIVFGVMGGMCVFFLVMALVVNPEMLLVTLLSDLGVMAVVSLITIPYHLLSEEEQKLYAENIMSVSSMLDELIKDQTMVIGLMEDAGVDEGIIDLTTNPAVIDSCSKQLELMCALK